MHDRPSRTSTVATVAGVAVVALAAGALLAWGPSPQESAAPAVTGASASVSETTTPSQPATPRATTSRPPTQSKRVVRQIRAARAAIPDRVILRQLRDAAERIARQQPQDTVPQPADIEPDSNRALGYQLMIDFGFAADQWPALDALWTRESGWNHLAENPSSGAYGIPQSLPAHKMAVAGGDWRSNPATQIRWGLAYISARYGVPDRAWAHSERVGWY